MAKIEIVYQFFKASSDWIFVNTISYAKREQLLPNYIHFTIKPSKLKKSLNRILNTCIIYGHCTRLVVRWTSWKKNLIILIKAFWRIIDLVALVGLLTYYDNIHLWLRGQSYSHNYPPVAWAINDTVVRILTSVMRKCITMSIIKSWQMFCHHVARMISPWD